MKSKTNDRWNNLFFSFIDDHRRIFYKIDLISFICSSQMVILKTISDSVEISFPEIC